MTNGKEPEKKVLVRFTLTGNDSDIVACKNACQDRPFMMPETIYFRFDKTNAGTFVLAIKP